ncbi:G1 family glutamic endopeptidase [Crenalkalicoccus roseus]|uniref:G1 family glutamic endopeptidase n=1 Tax=Crenalkalicoccus roseus TaxID=1485588 RepID=UPI001305205B|nr:G1 family glutamic endopeptidase [Crenalkalicoccus roseus]
MARCDALAFEEWPRSLPPLRDAHAAWMAWVRESVRPARPGPPPCGDDAPLLSRHWREMLDGAEYVPPDLVPDEPPLFRRTLVHAFCAIPHATPLLPPPRHEGDNWCGAVLRARRGLRFTEVAGRWRVPRCAAPPPAGDGEGPPPQGSAWIGFDGASLASRSLPQIGITFAPARNGGAPAASAWFQWWVRDRWSPPVRLAGLAVAPGQRVMGSLLVLSPTRVRGILRNLDTGRITGVEAEAPDLGGALGLCRGDGLRVAAATAAWIVERPADPRARDPDRQLHPLPLFPPVLFEGCAARAAAGPGEAGEEVPLRQARLLRMTDRRDAPRRSVVIATARMRGLPPGALLVERRRR